jgi:hypothetical protein
MRTEDLIERLAAQTREVRANDLLRRLLVATGIGTAATLIAVVVLYGLRPDLAVAVRGAPFWVKAAFTVGIAAFALPVVERVGRPGTRVQERFALLAIPFAFILLLACIELWRAPPVERVAIWLGHTWSSCPFSIAALSIPPLAMLLLALRRLAPTRPVVAGLAAGALSGGLAATAYGLHCPETSAAFIATWYALGILMSAALGAIAGARLLRW